MSYADGFAFNEVLPPTSIPETPKLVKIEKEISLTDKLLELKELCKTVETNTKRENFNGVAANKKEDRLKLRLGAYLAGRKLTSEETAVLGI